MKQNILTSKISFKLYYKTKQWKNHLLTNSWLAVILTLAIHLLYLKITLEYIDWHQTREMQHFLHIKDRQILLHTGKAHLNLKDQSKTYTAFVQVLYNWHMFRMQLSIWSYCWLAATYQVPRVHQVMYYHNYVSL